MSNVKSWLKNRSGFCDWPAEHQTRDRKLVNLDWLSDSSGSLAQHPGPMHSLRWCVGLVRPGGILYDHRGSTVSAGFFEPPVLPSSQWLVGRNMLSDWLNTFETRDRKLVDLGRDQASPAPVTMQSLRFVTGFIRPGGILYPNKQSRTTVATAEDDLLMDVLSTEEDQFLITEDTGEPLGLT